MTVTINKKQKIPDSSYQTSLARFRILNRSFRLRISDPLCETGYYTIITTLKLRGIILDTQSQVEIFRLLDPGYHTSPYKHGQSTPATTLGLPDLDYTARTPYPGY